MAPPRKPLLSVLRRLFGQAAKAPTEIQRARQLIAAIDAGGIPLNPAVVSDIARNLGLEVSRQAPVEQTIERIRRALERAGPH